MIVDNNLFLSGSIVGATVTGQTVTATGNTVSTNVVDLVTARDIGKGEAIDVFVGVTVAPVGGTTVQIQLVQADDAAITTNVNVLTQTDAIPIATLTLGKQIPIRVGRVDPNIARRYLALRYVLVGAFSAGAYIAGITNDVSDTFVAFPVGSNVL